jgi:phage tail-like protein
MMAFRPSGKRNDPFRGYNFVILLVDSASSVNSVLSSIQTMAQGGFSECSGLEMTMQPEEYKEGGNNGLTRKFASRVTWSNIRLKRGVTYSTTLWKWSYGFVEGKVKRKDGVIALMDDRGNPAKVWTFTKGIPVKWTGPSMDAMQNRVAIEELEIAHEGLKQITLSDIIADVLGLPTG